MKKAIICILCLIFCHLLNAQVNFEGKITANDGDEKLPISFATIILTSPTDSTSIIKAAITDINGDFIINNLRPKKYGLIIEMLGYETVCEKIRVVFPSTGTNYIRNYTLKQNITELDGVIVRGTTIKQEIDKTTYTITKRDLINTTHAIDVMAKIPQLTFDESTQKLSSVSGNIKILVNGANASEHDLMTLNSNNVKYVEFYDFPSARYAGYSTVLNVITKRLDKGFYAGINLQHAFTTGFFNDRLFLKYNWGKSQLSLDATSSYRNYNDVISKTSYSYKLLDIDYEKDELINKKFGYDDNNINLTFTRNVEDKYMFQVRLSPNFSHQHEEGAKKIDFLADTILNERYGDFKSNGNQFSPSLDVYSLIYLPKKQEISINLVGTQHSTNQFRNAYEYNTSDSSLVLEDIMTQDNKKKSIIGEIDYSKQFGLNTLSIGNRFQYEDLDSEIHNSFNDNNYFTNITKNNLYAEFSGMTKKNMYRFSTALNYFNNENSETKYDLWTVQPSLLLGYKFNDRYNLRTLYTRTTHSPTLSQLSSNKIFITDGIIQEGNPHLKNSVSDVVALIFDYRYKWINMNIVTAYLYQKRPINSYFIESDNLVSLKYENATDMEQVALTYSLLIDPFKEKFFTLKLKGVIAYTDINSPIVGISDYLTVGIEYEPTFNYKKFTLAYKGNPGGKAMDGTYLRSHEKTSTLSLKYKYKNLSVTAMCMWFLTDATYKTETINHSFVKYSHVNNIKDNRSMFILGIDYRFNIGEKYKESKRNIINSDKDSGVF